MNIFLNLTQSSGFIYIRIVQSYIESVAYVFALRSLDGQLIIRHIQLKILNVFIAITYQNLKSFTFQICMNIFLYFFFFTELLFFKRIITASLKLVITISPFFLINMYLLRCKNLDLKIRSIQKIWYDRLSLTRFCFLH